MYRTIATFTVSFLLFVTGASGQTSVATAELLLRKSGAWEQLAGIEHQVLAGFLDAAARDSRKPNQAEIERLRKVISTAYAPQKLYSSATEILAPALDEKHVPTILHWYNSPAGQAITKLEEEFNRTTASFDVQLLARQGTEAFQQSSAARRDLIVALIREVKAPDSMVDITLNVAIAVQRGVSASNPNAPAISVADLRASLEQQRPAMRQAFEELLRAVFSMTYSKLPDQELKQYVEFYSSAAGAHFNTVNLSALTRVLSKASEEMGKGLLGTKDQANI